MIFALFFPSPVQASRSAKRPSFISPKSQMAITSCIISFQASIYMCTVPGAGGNSITGEIRHPHRV